MGNSVGTFYLRNEQIAMKGSNEIASCIFDTILKKTREGSDDFRFWSDKYASFIRGHITGVETKDVVST